MLWMLYILSLSWSKKDFGSLRGHGPANIYQDMTMQAKKED